MLSTNLACCTLWKRSLTHTASPSPAKPQIQVCAAQERDHCHISALALLWWHANTSVRALRPFLWCAQQRRWRRRRRRSITCATFGRIIITCNAACARVVWWRTRTAHREQHRTQAYYYSTVSPLVLIYRTANYFHLHHTSPFTGRYRKPKSSMRAAICVRPQTEPRAMCGAPLNTLPQHNNTSHSNASRRCTQQLRERWFDLGARLKHKSAAALKRCAA